MTSSPSSLEELLSSLSLSSHLPKFQENEVDLDALRLLTEAELQELGIPLGPRKKIYAALHGKPALPPPAGAVEAASSSSSPSPAAPLSSAKPAPPPPTPAAKVAGSAPLAPPPPGASRLSSPSSPAQTTPAAAATRSAAPPAPAPPPASPKPPSSTAHAAPLAPSFPSSQASPASTAPVLSERPQRLRGVNADLIDAIQEEAVDRVREMIAALDPVLREEVRAGCYQGNLKIMQMLLDHGGERYLMTVDPKSERTLIHDAAQNGNTSVCQLLVELGVDPKQEDSDGRTAPQYAVEYEWPATVKYFASIGALPAGAAAPSKPSAATPAATKAPAPPPAKPAPGVKAPPPPPGAKAPASPAPALAKVATPPVAKSLPVQSVRKLQSVVPTERVSVASYLPPALRAEDYQERQYFIEIQRPPRPASRLEPLYRLWEPWCSDEDIATSIGRDKPDIGFALTEKQVALLKKELLALGIKETDLLVKTSKPLRKLLYAVCIAYLPLVYVLLTEHQFGGIDLAELLKWDDDSYSRPIPFTLIAWNNSKLTEKFTIPALKLFVEAGFDLETKCCTYGEHEHTLYDLALFWESFYPEIAQYFRSAFRSPPTTGNVERYTQRQQAASSSSYSSSSSSSSSSSASRKVTCSDCRGAGSVKCTGCKNGYWGPKNSNPHQGCKATGRSKCGRCRGSGEVRA